MFFFNNIKRYCFYTKTYENIKIIRRLRLEKVNKEKTENNEISLSINISETNKNNNLHYVINNDEKNFYDKIFNKIKQISIKNDTKNAAIVNISSEIKLNKNANNSIVFEKEKKDKIKNNFIIRIDKENKTDYNDDLQKDNRYEKKKTEEEVNEEEKYKYFKKQNDSLKNDKSKNNKNKIVKDEKYLKEKNKYLKRKDMYLKVKDEHIKKNRISKKDEKSNSYVKNEILMNKFIKNKKEKEKKNLADKSKDNFKVTDEDDIYNKDTRKNIHDLNNEKKLNKNIEKDKKYYDDYSCELTNYNIKNNKILHINNEIVDKNYIFVEYEQFWSNEKINDLLKSQKTTKDLKNKLFKGVLYVSPFDTSKCFVVNEESLSSKNNFFFVYGYISRNRALNNDIVYAYTARRKIRQIEEKENENQEENEALYNNINESKDENEKYCRVVNIVERRNLEIVGILNYLNIKENINNNFGMKEKTNNLKNMNCSDIKNYYNEIKNDNNEQISKINENFVKKNNIKIIKKENELNKNENENKNEKEHFFAKIQPSDTRLPCFIYDSSDSIINKILYYIKKKKISLCVLVKFKEWEKNQINPLGNISKILGNEKNFFGMIYLLLHFYKINFHIYNENDMFYLNSRINVNERIINNFINRKKHALMLDDKNKGNVTYFEQYDKKINYLKNLKEKSKNLEKYMIKCFLKNRDIITHLDIFTIDPLNAKDLDDALSIEFVENKNNLTNKFQYKIGIHISDVSFFISPNSYYDNIASKICNTIYMDFLVIHMLPSILSEEICSLNTKSEKLSFSIFFYLNDLSNPYNITKNENLENIEIKKCLIKSQYKLNYDLVEDFLDDIYFNMNERSETIKEQEEKILINGDLNLNHFVNDFQNLCKKYNLSVKIGSDIFRLYLLSKMLKKKTKRKNIYQKYSLLFSFNNTDNNHNEKKIIPVSIEEITKEYLLSLKSTKISLENFLQREKYKNLLNETNIKNVSIETFDYKKKSHMLIEEMMILANFLVAHKISCNNRLGVLRVHQDTTEEIKKNFLKIIDYNTYNKINNIIDIYKNSINDILLVCEKILNKNQLLCLHYNILKYYKEAIYIPSVEGENNSDHFGLLLNKYIHFTSPIRRYIDIIIHRILNNIIENKKICYNYEELKKICDQCNYQKKKTDEAQIHMKNFFLNKYLVYLNDMYKNTKKKKEKNLKKKVLILNEKNQVNDENEKGIFLDEKNETYKDKTEAINKNEKDYMHTNDICEKKEKGIKENYLINNKSTKKEKCKTIKKYFYLNKGIVSFLTEAYIQEIIITKNIKENICLNILKNNYICVNEKEDNHLNKIIYTCFTLDSSKNIYTTDNIVDNKNTNYDNVNLFNNTSKSDYKNMNNNNEENLKLKLKKNSNENGKLKNAIVFYVPLLETEKSISDNLLNLQFNFILLSYNEGTFIYNLSKDILFKINMNCYNIDETFENYSLDEEEKSKDINSENEKKRNEHLYNIFKILSELNLEVKYKMLKLEDRKEFQKIYDDLYIHDVFIKKNEDVHEEDMFKGKINNENINEENINKKDVDEKTLDEKYLNENINDNYIDKNNENYYIEHTYDKNMEFKYCNKYEKVSRFQKIKIFIIPGSQMWTLNLL
ncbi:exoribonuclease II, putative [Plasmodium gallinaceum]|uniref:Exoribonuclease II, putative n=1 Tax=Plasmodium gallinaceum TaxID=5849 RepID=A0A1J1GWA6_PLAGA|nr:exoribonuclease II, putative [Plasmodium gallinaceum]CRG96605.1 exoribonuclease II, putative [Plasmodium gallinaceum]